MAVPVLLPLPVAAPVYHYALPENIDQSAALPPGTFVEVPFARRTLYGVVWDSQSPLNHPPDSSITLRPIKQVLPLPGLDQAHRSFIEWMADYVMAPPGLILKMALPVPAAFTPRPPVQLVAISDTFTADHTLSDRRLSVPRLRVLEKLGEAGPLSQQALGKAAAVSASVIQRMIQDGMLERITPPTAEPGLASYSAKAPDLNPEQAKAAQLLCSDVEAGGFKASLLDGVTGSGKTEVYFAAIDKILTDASENGDDRTGQVLVLLPEIALSGQLLGRFKTRFGFEPLLWHSELTPARRRDNFLSIHRGEASIILGARSALHLPYRNLRLIVVDEEHDPSYKQSDGVSYQARDMAVARAWQAQCPIILASATPSLETLVNARSGRYRHIKLPNRHGPARLPDVQLIDLTRERPPRQSFISDTLCQALAANLESQAQSLLFLNRRGYAPLTLCRKCGFRVTCRHCSAWMVEHRRPHRLECHHCGYRIRPLVACPDCGSEEDLAPCGPGVERLHEEVIRLFPDARVAEASSETLKGPLAAAQFVEAMENREIDIVIGTQIIAKGYHFPHLTLVGIIDADLGLQGGDLRAGERCFQLLHQVAGRAGREDRPGRVLIQTALAEANLMQALEKSDRDQFMHEEERARYEQGWPPFAKLALLLISSRDEQAVDDYAALLIKSGPTWPGLDILGPAVPGIPLLRDHHRRLVLVKAENKQPLQSILRDWMGKAPPPRQVTLRVDINPYQFW